jgi:hypothetical protein
MHILFEKVGAFVASMTIEYSKIAAPWPSSFEIGFCYIHDDGDSIFVIIFDESVIGVDCIALYGSISAFDEFDCLDFGKSASLFLLILIHSLFNDYLYLN